MPPKSKSKTKAKGKKDLPKHDIDASYLVSKDSFLELLKSNGFQFPTRIPSPSTQEEEESYYENYWNPIRNCFCLYRQVLVHQVGKALSDGDRRAVLAAVERRVNEMIGKIYSEDIWDCIPPLDGSPQAKEKFGGELSGLAKHQVDLIMSLLGPLVASRGMGMGMPSLQTLGEKMKKDVVPPPSEWTSPFTIFSSDSKQPTATNWTTAPAMARAIGEGRLSVTTENFSEPHDFDVFEGFVAYTGGCGWKNRDPSLYVGTIANQTLETTRPAHLKKLEYETKDAPPTFDAQPPPTGGEPSEATGERITARGTKINWIYLGSGGFYEPGSAVAFGKMPAAQTAGPGPSGGEDIILWAAGDERIKGWKVTKDEKTGKPHAELAYTLYAGESGAASLLVHAGRLFASTHSKVLVWDLSRLTRQDKEVSVDELESETADEEELLDLTDQCMRDEVDDVEVTKGQLCHDSIPLQVTISQRIGAPGICRSYLSDDHLLLYETSGALCVLDFVKKSVEMRMIGHTSSIVGCMTTPDLPNYAATHSRDRTVKIWDLRTGECALTLVGEQDKPAYGGCLAVIGGHPFCFTANCDESVKVWDLNPGSGSFSIFNSSGGSSSTSPNPFSAPMISLAAKCIYKISTGNNTVLGIKWDAATCTLLVMTECMWMDRLGYRHEYTAVRVTKPGEEVSDSEDGSWESEGEGEGESEGHGGGRLCVRWPSKAHHQPGEFRKIWDAANSGIHAYSFAEFPIGFEAPNMVEWCDEDEEGEEYDESFF